VRACSATTPSSSSSLKKKKAKEDNVLPNSTVKNEDIQVMSLEELADKILNIKKKYL